MGHTARPAGVAGKRARGLAQVGRRVLAEGVRTRFDASVVERLVELCEGGCQLSRCRLLEGWIPKTLLWGWWTSYLPLFGPSRDKVWQRRDPGGRRPGYGERGGACRSHRRGGRRLARRRQRPRPSGGQAGLGGGGCRPCAIPRWSRTAEHVLLPPERCGRPAARPLVPGGRGRSVSAANLSSNRRRCSLPRRLRPGEGPDRLELVGQSAAMRPCSPASSRPAWSSSVAATRAPWRSGGRAASTRSCSAIWARSLAVEEYGVAAGRQGGVGLAGRARRDLFGGSPWSARIPPWSRP